MSETTSTHRFVPLSKSQHAGLRWRRFENWAFAKGDVLAPLVDIEILRAAAQFPIAFARSQEGAIEPVAVLGLQSGENLFVGPAGEWGSEYVPAVLRSRPFIVGSMPGGQNVLCVDEASGLLSPDEGEPLFNPDGELGDEVKKVTGFLGTLGRSRQSTIAACAALAKHGCLKALALPEGFPQSSGWLSQLQQIDAAKLDTLEPEALQELHRLHALLIAHAQLVSSFHLPALGKVFAHRRAAERAAEPPPDLSVLDRNGTLVFGPLG